MKAKKIAIFLPVAYRGGSMQGAKNLVKMIYLGAKSDNESIEVVFSCLKDSYDVEEDFADLLEFGIAIRETEWKKITKEETQIALEYLGSDKKLTHGEYLLPTDGINNFCDCKFWLIVSDRTFAPVAPVAPYGIVIYDYIQRYIPDIFGDDKGVLDAPFIASARSAEIIFCTTPQTREDTIQYAGVTSEKIILAPMEFNPLRYTSKQYFDEPMDYLIWTTNKTFHKNHIVALRGLLEYYEKLNGKLKVVIIGAETEYFRKDHSNDLEYVNLVRQLIGKHSALHKNLLILGELSEDDYISVLAGAQFLFHPALYDNGTFSVIEAAYHGIPSISSHYPQMRYIDERFHLGMKFFDPRKPEQIAKTLKAAEIEHEEMRKALPSQTFLEQFTYEKLSSEYWSIIKGYL